MSISLVPLSKYGVEIEIMNVSNGMVEVCGTFLLGGERYNFPRGHVCVVKNLQKAIEHFSVAVMRTVSRVVKV